jgi:hypothetical protein
MSGEQLKPPTCKICKGQRRRENAAGKFNRQLGKYPGKISGASQSAIFCGEFHIFLLANSSGNGKYIGRPIIADATGQGGNPARDASRF